jgi:membrane fusion protein (multidrug efflux system)
MTGLIVVSLVAALLLCSCGTQRGGQPDGTKVKAMKVLQQDAPSTFEYAGQITGKDEVKVQAKVSGKVMQKYIRGGDTVQEGQPLFKIDSRQYESDVQSAQAKVAESEATLTNAQTDLVRDQSLLAADAVSEQTVTTQRANVKSYQAVVDADNASLRKAQQNLDDTVVYAPMSGKLSVDDVAEGTYANAGSTALVTIGSSNPVYVQFSLSENDYLKYMDSMSLNADSPEKATVSIVLSNGTAYPISGEIVQSDRALSDNTGTLKMKALFDNPEGVLKPGMFARVKLTGKTISNAILVPQRAVQQLLDKSFVIVVGADNKSESKTVTLGDKIGSYYVITEGLTADDIVVVEGLTNLQEGKTLDAQMVTPEEMGFSLTTSQTTATISNS